MTVEHRWIDHGRFCAAFPIDFRNGIAKTRADLHMLSDFWGGAGFSAWDDRGRFLPSELKQASFGGDLYQPNIAALDFLLREIERPEEKTVLDFACGIGNLLPYLERIGFSAYGYDSWDQLRKEYAVAFLLHYELEDRLLTCDELEGKDFTVINFVGLNWDRAQDCLSPLLGLKSTQYFMHDKVGEWEQDIPLGSDFRAIAEYDHLLRVFQKMSSNS